MNRMNRQINEDYFVVRDINFARVLKWICGESYMVFDSRYFEGEKVYSFRKTPKLKQALQIASEIKDKVR